MKPKTILTVAILTVVAASCRTVGNLFSPKEETFESFYSQFYSDSTFQRSRVTFPLPGFNMEVYQQDPTQDVDTNYHWQASDFPFLSTIDGTSATIDGQEYKKELNVDEGTAQEKLYMDDAGFFIENRFRKIDGKWFLVFFYDASSL